MRHGIEQIETDANTIAAYSSREILYAYLVVKIIYDLISQIMTISTSKQHQPRKYNRESITVKV